MVRTSADDSVENLDSSGMNEDTKEKGKRKAQEMEAPDDSSSDDEVVGPQPAGDYDPTQAKRKKCMYNTMCQCFIEVTSLTSLQS